MLSLHSFRENKKKTYQHLLFELEERYIYIALYRILVNKPKNYCAVLTIVPSAFVKNRAHAKAGETVLVHGASGGVGRVTFFKNLLSQCIQFTLVIYFAYVHVGRHCSMSDRSSIWTEGAWYSRDTRGDEAGPPQRSTCCFQPQRKRLPGEN